MKTKSSRPSKSDELVRKAPSENIEARFSPDLLVAAIGASAGGLEAGIDLVRGLDPDMGIAYVFIQHLDPTHRSIMKDLLARETSIPVTEVTEGAVLSPNHIYVIPPNTLMTIEDHILRLTPREPFRGGHMPIDYFMRALAAELGNRAIGVILSGTGSDGMLGMSEIQAHGGVTFVQDPVTAKHDGMPRSAITAGCADYILPPGKIAGELARLAHHPYVSPTRHGEIPSLARPDGSGIDTVFQLLRRTARVDFTHYRKTTILRRLQRRMLFHKIDRLADYVRFLQSNPAEVRALYQDMLINVTSFFRNPNVFESLKRVVFPHILKKKGSDSNIRIWVPGCASGEEVYSLAIVLLEYLGSKETDIPIQLFGTDISENSIKRARAGVYPANIQGDVTPERIRRFFSKIDGNYQINKNVREMCIFAQHNLVNDAPFSRMGLICCRNLLIYFEPVLQGRVVSLFHYALRPGGFLVLGTSEGVSAAADLFNVEDREAKIFSKKASSARQIVTFSMNKQSEPSVEEIPIGDRLSREEPRWSYLESQRDFDRRLLTHHVPPTVFINEDLEIIHTRGKIDRYFKIPSGRPTLNILKMAVDDLALPLQGAILLAKKEKRPVSRTGISVKLTNGAKSTTVRQIVGFEVSPLKTGMNEICFMVVFHEQVSTWPETKSGKAGSKLKQRKEFSNKELKRLEHELAATKGHLESLVENQEIINEELQSANEEILSSNEELQSTNEELETAKEELQSTNEELNTLNDELRNRNLQIAKGQKDLRDLLASLAVAVVDSDSRVLDFAPPSRTIIGLLPSDIANLILRTSHSSDIPDFAELVKKALAAGAASGDHTVEHGGRSYRVHVLPFKGPDEKKQGSIVTVIDASAIRTSEVSSASAERAEEEQDDQNGNQWGNE